MKLTLGVLQDSAEALNGIGQVKLPAPISYRLARILKAVKEPLTTLDETKQKLLDEVGTPDLDKPGMYKINDGPRWQSEIKALMEQEVEVEVVPLKLADFGDAEVEARWFAALDWCIKEA
jgi:hypothetical protein